MVKVEYDNFEQWWATQVDKFKEEPTFAEFESIRKLCEIFARRGWSAAFSLCLAVFKEDED